MVLGFEALCALNAPKAYQREGFSIAYALRWTPQDGRYFVPQIEVNKNIINMVDNDHDM